MASSALIRSCSTRSPQPAMAMVSTTVSLRPVRWPMVHFLQVSRSFGMFGPPQLDITPVARIIKRANTKPTPGEGLVLGGHDRRFHVVEKNLDQPGGHHADDLYRVPAVVPGRAFRRSL